MSIRVAHIVSSLRMEPGSPVVVLPGLVEKLQSLGVSARIEAPGHPPDADVVHVHGWDDQPMRDTVAELARSKRRFVLSPLGGLSAGQDQPWPFRKRLKYVLRHQSPIRAAKALIAVNELEANRLTEDRRHAKVVTLPYGGAAIETQSASSPDKRKALYVGSLHPRFGCVAMLLAIAELGSLTDGWSIEVAGGGDPKWRMKLEAAVLRQAGDDRVRFVAAEDARSQAELIRGASLVVTPSLHYDAGISMIQAVSAGVPVIATTLATPPELGDTVIRCEPRRDALREALCRALAMSDADRSAQGQRARTAFANSLDWSVLAPRYAALYENVARG